MNFQFKAPSDTVNDKTRDEFEELNPGKSSEIEEEERALSEESLEGTQHIMQNSQCFSNRFFSTNKKEKTETT
jgi:hypothetical protein